MNSLTYSRLHVSILAMRAPARIGHFQTGARIAFCLFCGLVLLVCVSAPAQTYSIDWFKIAGGGGSSTNGQYSVTGTIGQPDAGHMSGGSYTLDGGFWGIVASIQSAGSPLLTIAFASPTTVQISWPSPSTDFSLQENLTFSPTTWNTIPATNTDNGTIKSIVVPAGPGNRFYRLKQ